MSEIPSRLDEALSGRYKVEREIGEGGMATVYLARDVRHNRPVALKVLKPELAAVVGAERFLAEIETTANLHHPHILPLFDSGEADGFLFFVMPFVEGETLRARIERERQLPVDEAVKIAIGVANALHHAHERGVIHRDIKPANILLQDGEPVVADFGIALAVGAAGGSRLTETGLSIGTPFYMSPEQATGDQHVGPQSDTYALAAVLYEMLTGEPPYTGTTAQAVLGRILQGAPVSATELRKAVPAHVDAAIRKALEKLPADRFAGPHLFARALADPGFRHGTEAPVVGDGPGAWKPLALGGWAAAAVVALALGWSALRPEAAPTVEWFESPFREGQEPVGLSYRDYTISDDGTLVVYTGPFGSGSGGVLWARRWTDPEAREIPGTTDGTTPRISPDGKELAFSQLNELKVVALSGGPVRTLSRGRSPVWGPDGFIYFTGAGGAVQRVPAGGGAVETMTTLPLTGENYHEVSDILPGGEHALVTVSGFLGQSDTRVLDLETGVLERLTADGALARYSQSGHLVLVSADGDLLAARYDPKRPFELGTPAAVVDRAYSFALSRTGRLVYSTAGTGNRAELVWVSRDGGVTPVDPGWTFDPGGGPNAAWSLSPDGSRIAVRELSDGSFDVWIKNLRSGTHTRLTNDPSDEYMPRWSPDGASLVFVADRAGNQQLEMDVWTRRADGTGEERLLVEAERGLVGAFWAPGGEWLVLRTAGSVAIGIGARDVWAIRPGVDSVAMPLPGVSTLDYAEQAAAVSHDGRWIAYTSNETGRDEVFVRPFPDTDAGKYPVSSAGGWRPVWAHSGRELFYRSSDSELMVAEVDTSDGFEVVSQRVLFDLPERTITAANADFYHVTPDDQRFLMGRGVRDGEGEFLGLVLVTNFDRLLLERVGR